MKRFDIKDTKEESPHTNEEMDIGGPISLWIGLSAIAAIVQIFVYPAIPGNIVSPLLSYANIITAHALYVPGVFVLPILAALWLGSRAGATKGSTTTVAYRAFINSIYVSVVYLIEIFIFYIISSSTKTGVFASMPMVSFLEYVVALPIVVCLIVAPLFAMISSARRY